MAATKAIVELRPAAVELVDRTMIELAREIPMFRPIVERFVRGAPEALLLVEFAGEDAAREPPRPRAARRADGRSGISRRRRSRRPTTAFQTPVWEVRAHGLNIMMSMKGDGKPISFIEDCAVPLDDLADYTARLDDVFSKHGTYGTWYAHASVGTLHVRPVLNLKQELEVKKMRAIAEEAFAIVREYKGSHSGEHGDGIVRSEFHEPMFGDAPRARLRGGEGHVRSRRPLQSRQDRAAAADGRPLALPLPAGLRDRGRGRGRSTGRSGAASPARSRCATTTAPAARPIRA